MNPSLRSEGQAAIMQEAVAALEERFVSDNSAAGGGRSAVGSMNEARLETILHQRNCVSAIALPLIASAQHFN